MAATIRDIKKRTGLSLATISKYLNGGNVLPENRILIEEAINELHYEVNELARGLVTHKTKTIGVLVYDIQCLFVGSMLHYLGMELHKKGYGMLICDSCNDEKLQKENLQFLFLSISHTPHIICHIKFLFLSIPVTISSPFCKIISFLCFCL